jgi:AAHS family 4-hydroxybenzoate transporter-like MFS transporter
MHARTFDLQAFIDRQKVGMVHMTVLVLCFLIMFIDGYDMFMLGKIAPAIAADFGVSTASMTLVVTLQQIGLAVGAFLISPLGDRVGRKRMLVVCASAFGMLTIATVFTSSILSMAILRGITGIFLSAVLPLAVSLISEFTPKARRATFIAVGMTGFSFGNAGGALAAIAVPEFGWQAGFWAGGLAPLILVPILLLKLPESLAHSSYRNPQDPAIARTIRKMDPNIELTGDEVFVSTERSTKGGKTNPIDLFRDGRLGVSVVLFTACFMSMGTIALLAAWLPSFFSQMAGIPIERFAVAALFGLLGGIGGMLSIGWLMDRVHPTLPIPAFFVLYATSIFLLGQVSFESAAFIPLLFALSLFQGGGQAGLNMTMARIYPVFVRSSGIGWAGGAGRIGGVILPLFGGFALASAFSLQVTLMMVAIPPLIVALLALMLLPRSSSAEHQPRDA